MDKRMSVKMIDNEPFGNPNRRDRYVSLAMNVNRPVPVRGVVTTPLKLWDACISRYRTISDACW
jgi:hypothetical protein